MHLTYCCQLLYVIKYFRKFRQASQACFVFLRHIWNVVPNTLRSSLVVVVFRLTQFTAVFYNLPVICRPFNKFCELYVYSCNPLLDRELEASLPRFFITLKYSWTQSIVGITLFFVLKYRELDSRLLQKQDRENTTEDDCPTCSRNVLTRTNVSLYVWCLGMV